MTSATLGLNRLLLLLAFAACALAAPASGQPGPEVSAPGDQGAVEESSEDTPYLDNRSTATDVIRSLYNAINLGEYLRAWSYFHEPERPEIESFVAGYADTELVVLEVGEETAEGAAGTIYWTVPVAIEARHTDGTTEIFSGCYVLAQPNPGIQAEPPFEPISIREGSLSLSDGPLEEAVPAEC